MILAKRKNFIFLRKILNKQNRFLSASPDENLINFNKDLVLKLKKNNFFYAELNNVKNKKYLEIPVELQKYLPSVSKIMSETMTDESSKILEIWKAKMIKKLGLEGFQKYQNDLFSKGKRLHKNIEYTLKNKEENVIIDDDIKGYWESLKPILTHIKQVHLIEEKIIHPTLLYKGIVDCVVKVENKAVVIDWKTSEKIKDNVEKLYDAPIQTVAYLGALNHSKLLDFELNNIAVAVVYNTGRIGNFHQFEIKDCIPFWNTWIRKVEQYWLKTLSKSPIDQNLIDFFNEQLIIHEKRKFQNLKNLNLILDPLDKNLKKLNFKNDGLLKKKFMSKKELVDLMKKNTD